MSRESYLHYTKKTGVLSAEYEKSLRNVFAVSAGAFPSSILGCGANNKGTARILGKLLSGLHCSVCLRPERLPFPERLDPVHSAVNEYEPFLAPIDP